MTEGVVVLGMAKRRSMALLLPESHQLMDSEYHKSPFYRVFLQWI